MPLSDLLPEGPLFPAKPGKAENLFIILNVPPLSRIYPTQENTVVPQTALNTIWEQHRLVIRRLLIAWTRDFELADDLLQETYLRAHAGFAAYRGGDARAWLTAIAKNLWYAHCRQRKVEEQLIDNDSPSDDAGSNAHLTALIIRQEIAKLPLELQTALILRHYGSYSYQQIAERCACPVGTARQRVWTAIRRLQQALGVARKEKRAMASQCLKGITILEYLYGVMSPKRRTAIEHHLATCNDCRNELQQLQQVITSLDSAAGELVLLYLTELDAEGVPTYYVWSRMPGCWVRNRGHIDSPHGEFHIFNAPGMITDFLALQGEEVEMTSQPWKEDPSRLHYVARLPHPIGIEDSFDGMAVSHMADHTDRAADIGQGQWRFTTQLGLGAQRDAQIIILGVRLPEGAQYVDSTPQAETVTQHGITTVYWRFTPAPDQPVEVSVDYALKDATT